MAKRMLIDATHAEETRVVVCTGTRLDDFDYETTSKKQLKGNIYLAKITRVEPSLQAAFVDYGGNRHGFLPFSEIHPDYYRIPIADREALIAAEASLRAEDPEDLADDPDEEPDLPEAAAAPEEMPEEDSEAAESAAEEEQEGAGGKDTAEEPAPEAAAAENGSEDLQEVPTETDVDTVGGDEVEDAARVRAKLMRHYKIQEVIKRRQIILIQVAKEERGNKGAALTTYLSLAGRYCVLMPNTNKGGGISRKISNGNDRRRLKSILSELSIPEGIAVIVRTAGAQRTKPEIKRDYEYLLRLWNEVRDTTLKSDAPALIHEEASLIKRAIRDLYTRDMDEILVDGEGSYKAAKNFMKSLMPSHAKKVQQYKGDSAPLFQHYKVEGQLDSMHSNTVQLRSGGYIVLNPTEALVAIDVNSGKATRERHIEETALKTNLEAAEEVGRQLRLRDLAGLIVIDFIDMESSRHNREVERKLKDALRHDRARIQLGRISPFGLLEMSRQRLRPSFFESSSRICPHCEGSGYMRTTESSALHVLRALEEDGSKRAGGEIRLSLPTEVALYLLNQKRRRLVELEQRYELEVDVVADNGLVAPDFRLERAGAAPEPRRSAARSEESEERGDGERPRARRRRGGAKRDREERPTRDEVAASPQEAGGDSPAAGSAEEEPKKRRRRGKRGGRRRGSRTEETTAVAAESADTPETGEASESSTADAAQEHAPIEFPPREALDVEAEDAGKEEKPRRRRAARKKKAATAEADAPETNTAETPPSEEAGDAAEASEATETAEENADAPKRKRAAAGTKKTAAKRAPRRKKAAANGEAPTSPETAAAPDPMPEPTPGPTPEPAPEPTPDIAAAPPPPAPEMLPDVAQTAASKSDTESAEPKRRGWWNRFS